jgi:hypothetical protein
LYKVNNKKKAMAKMNYDEINFKNKDVDKFATKFGNGVPMSKQTPAQKDSTIASMGLTPAGDGLTGYRPKSQAEKSANKQSARQSNPAKGKNVDTTVSMRIRKETEEAGKPRPTFMPKKK